MMNTYINDQLLVADKVLLMYSGKDRDFVLPEELSGQPVKKIGMGAFKSVTSLESITLSPEITCISHQAFEGCPHLRRVTLTGSVEDVGSRAFAGCPKLEEICIRYLPVPRREINTFEQSCVTTAEKLRYSAGMPGMELVQKLVSALSGVGTPSLTPQESLALLRDPAPTGYVTADTFRTVTGPYAFHETMLSLPELMIVMKMMETGDYQWKSGRVELENDLLIRQEKYLEPERTCLFTLEKTGEPDRGELSFVDLHIWVGHFFWPSLVPVIWEGKEYFVYRRLYMESSLKNSMHSKPGYLRRDMAVFGHEGLMMDEEISRRVYAKYVLPTLL